jgi:hypothetical protein
VIAEGAAVVSVPFGILVEPPLQDPDMVARVALLDARRYRLECLADGGGFHGRPFVRVSV